MTKSVPVAIILLTTITLTACAGPNTVVDTPNASGDVAGFWWGLWNGLTVPFSFFGSLFDDGISIYEVHNNGGWYNFGFFLGVGALGSSGASSARN